jgi:hypothetical protein
MHLVETEYCTLYQKSDFCIPRNETAVHNSYIHVSVSDLYIPRISLPIWLQLKKQPDHGIVEL